MEIKLPKINLEDKFDIAVTAEEAAHKSALIGASGMVIGVVTKNQMLKSLSAGVMVCSIVVEEIMNAMSTKIISEEIDSEEVEEDEDDFVDDDLFDDDEDDLLYKMSEEEIKAAQDIQPTEEPGEPNVTENEDLHITADSDVESEAE